MRRHDLEFENEVEGNKTGHLMTYSDPETKTRNQAGHNSDRTTNETMIARIWHGWTTHHNADSYEALLRTEIFSGIRDRAITGFKGIQLLRREIEGKVEFVTIMQFDSIESVREFAGEDYEIAVVPDKARALLSRFDQKSQHYEIVS